MENLTNMNEIYVTPKDDKLLAKKVVTPKGRVCINPKYLYDFYVYKVSNHYRKNGMLYYELTDAKGYIATINANDVSIIDKNNIELKEIGLF